MYNLERSVPENINKSSVHIFSIQTSMVSLSGFPDKLPSHVYGQQVLLTSFT